VDRTQLRFSTQGWRFVAGDYTGDSVDDLLAYHPSDGSVWVARNRLTDLDFVRVGTMAPAAGWTFTAGDFNGDSIADLSAYRSDGRVWTAQVRLALAAPNTGGNGNTSPQMQCAADAFFTYQACVQDASTDPDPTWRAFKIDRCTADYEDTLRSCVGVIAH
jgi:hypothetical protein